MLCSSWVKASGPWAHFIRSRILGFRGVKKSLSGGQKDVPWAWCLETIVTKRWHIHSRALSVSLSLFDGPQTPRRLIGPLCEDLEAVVTRETGRLTFAFVIVPYQSHEALSS